ncbi:DUF550 domain-containing protein [Salmonella enterica]|nr:DUF550 domain-containing protein [Salmonella enterica]EJT0323401.1 DUF550 domain-containing protein [Salmonella enterica]
MTTITSKFTKERLIDWAVVAVAERGRDLKDAPESVEAAANLKLAEIALAALTAEPVRYLNKFSGTCVTLEQQSNAADDVAVYIPLYAAPPVLEREQIRREHAEWSDKTFGNVGPVGPLKHLSKEALEAAADPSDPLEWADMQFLLWDAQRRMGLSDEFITRAMIEKLEINKSRQWPEPKDGEPRLHIKEQPVLVVPEEIEPDSNNTYDYVDGWNACRAAMLQGDEPVSETYTLPELIEGMEVSIDVSTCDADAGNRYFGTVTEVSELDTAKNGYILLVQDAKPNFDVNGNSPVTPDGWKLAPEKADEDMIAEGNIMVSCMIETVGKIDVSLIYGAMLAAAPEKETEPCTK